MKKCLSPQEKEQQVDNARICVICCEKPKTIVHLPCRHLTACPTCAIALSTCPLCRAPVQPRSPENFFMSEVPLYHLAHKKTPPPMTLQ